VRLRLYLDQKDLSALAKETGEPGEVHRRIMALVKEKRVVMVLSRAHAFETASISDTTLREAVVSLVEQLPEVLWLPFPHVLCQMEVERCFRRDVEGEPPGAWSPLTKTVVQQHPELRDASWDPGHEFRALVRMLLPGTDPRTQVIRNTQRAWSALWKAASRRHVSALEFARSHMLWRLVPARTLRGLHVSDATRREYARSLGFARCPSYNLCLQVVDALARQPLAQALPGDLFDQMHLHAVPYCEMTTMDRRTFSLVERTSAGKGFVGKVARNMEEAFAKMESQLRGTPAASAG